MDNLSSICEHPVLLQLSAMIDTELLFLGLWHQVQTYLSYYWLQTLLSPAWVCPWDTMACRAKYWDSIRDSQYTRSWQGALNDGGILPEPISGPPSVAAPDNSDPSLYNTTHSSSLLYAVLLHFYLWCSSFLWVTNRKPVGNVVQCGENAEE